MKVTPKNENVLIVLDENDKEEVGGVILPDTITVKPTTGTVVTTSVDEQEYKAGDKVVLPKNVGIEIDVNDDKCMLIKATDILATFTD